MTNTRQVLLALGLAAASAAPALLATTIAIPASAQVSVSISFDTFHSRLAPYGTWSNHPRWGEVWHPTRVDRDFRPYYNGHWVNTREYGWLWVSNDSWGDIPYHYGRWVYDPRDGWLWVPGFVWGPSWVVWRSGGGNIGWFPMPPGDDYYGDGPYRDRFDNQYGYRDWYGSSFGNDQFLSLWIFVGQDHFGDRDYRNYALPQRDYGRFISQTTNITNYITINNYVVNRSIDANRLPRDTNQRFQPVPASSVISREALVTRADTGRQVEQRERQRRPIPANINPAEPRGRAVDREPAKAFVEPSPQTGRGAGSPTAPLTPAAPPDASRQQPGRGQANINPNEQRGRGSNSNVQQPNAVQAPQGSGGRGGDRGPNSKGPDQPNPQTDRVAPVVNAPPANTPPQTRGAPAPSGKAIVQETRTPPRVQGNVPAVPAVPAVDGQGKGRGNRQGDTKNADDQKAADDLKAADDKKADAGRGRN